MGSEFFWHAPVKPITDGPCAIEIDNDTGTRLVEIVEGVTIRDCVYSYIRRSHHFLNGANHQWDREVADGPQDWEDGSVAIRYNDHDHQPFFGRRVGPGDHWFSVNYRIVSPAVIDRDIAHQETYKARYWSEIGNLYDSRRGRKRAMNLLGLIEEFERKQRVFLGVRNDLIAGRYFVHSRRWVKPIRMNS